MDRLREIPRVRQDGPAEVRRRWFNAETADLYLWESADGLRGFEFCYGKPNHEHALIWSATEGLRHARIDDGEAHAFEHCSPIAVADGAYDADTVALELERLGANLEPPTFRAVLRLIHLGR